MIKFKILIIYTSIFFNSIGQETLIPYRIGAKFGFSNIKGQLLVDAIFDDISINPNYPKGFFDVYKSNNNLLLYNSNLIISDTNYTDYSISNNNFILAAKKIHWYDNKFTLDTLEYRSIYNYKGVNLYPANFKFITQIDSFGISSENINKSKYLIFYVEKLNKKKSMFVFDVDKQVISEWLIKDAVKLDTKTRKFHSTLKSALVILGKINETDVEKEFYIIFENNSVRFGELSEVLEIKKAILEKEKLAEANYEGWEPMVEEKPDEIDYTKSIKLEFIQNGDKVFLNRSLNGKNPTLIEIPLNVDSYVIKKIRPQSILEKNRRSTIYNYIQYRSKGKIGLFMSDSIKVEAIFDTVKEITIHAQTYFLVGIRNANEIYYGTIDITGKTIIPMLYDKIFFNENLANNQWQTIWKIEKNDKMGAIFSTNKMLVEPIYDEIFKGDKGMLILQLVNKYGVMINESGYTKKVEPIFTEQPTDYIKDYQGDKDLFLFLFQDEKTNFRYYGTEDGFLYYKE